MIQFIKNNFNTILLRLIQIATIIIALCHDLVLGFGLLLYAIYLTLIGILEKINKKKKVDMEVKKIIKVNKTEKRHDFYCDNCKKYIGFSFNYDDGYYEKLGEVEKSIYIYNDWYKIKKTLCEDCKIDFYNNIIKHLKELGFRQEKH